MPQPSRTHVILIPSFNSGDQLPRVLAGAAARWLPICVIVDASTDGSAEPVRALAAQEPAIHLLELAENAGKGGAVLEGLRFAAGRGFSHALVMDADGQHGAESIEPFMRRSIEAPDAMILGVPVFGADAPIERVKGRRIGNWWAKFSTLGGAIQDSLFGFRVYPIRQTLAILERIRTARRFDFDTEIAIRLYWAGVRPINIPVRVFYPQKRDGGVTHFRYVRDNLLLIGTHTRLVLGMLARLPRLVRLRARS